MKTNLLLSLTILTSHITFSQTANPDSIVKEGKRLYHSEMASWYGSDLFVEKFKDQRQNLGGYFSYQDQNKSKCVFYTKGEMPTILVTITFDSTYNTRAALVNSDPRDFSQLEQDLMTLRKNAKEVIDADTLFKTYVNTTLNLIPLISGGEKKVYVLTGPQSNGVVIFGNDYLLTFDQALNLISKRQLHRNIIRIEFGEQDKEVIGSMHSHLPETGDLITATDICTLMLYGRFTKWKQHIVISERYVSIWDCEKNLLATLTKEAWEKIKQ